MRGDARGSVPPSSGVVSFSVSRHGLFLGTSPSTPRPTRLRIPNDSPGKDNQSTVKPAMSRCPSVPLPIPDQVLLVAWSYGHLWVVPSTTLRVGGVGDTVDVTARGRYGPCGGGGWVCVWCVFVTEGFISSEYRRIIRVKCLFPYLSTSLLYNPP